MSKGFWRRLWAPLKVEMKANAQCPVCGEPVVVAADMMQSSAYSGPIFSPRPPEELVAACAVHGRAPFNQQTLAFLQQRDY
jgi:hypothetical protein